MSFALDLGLTSVAANERSTISFSIRGPITRADLPGLCERICSLLERSGATVAVCDVGGVGGGAVTVDALARLELAARRRCCQMILREVSAELRELIGFMGLQNVLLRVESRRQAE